MSLSLTSQIAVLLVLVGCCSNVIFLELLVKLDPGVGNLVTFASFTFISIEGLFFTVRWFTIPTKVPMMAWATLVFLYFLVSVSNNYALSFNISMPLHMMFRAGSLMANMLLGMILLGKRYSKKKYLAVIMISVGISACTIMSGKSISDKATEAHSDDFYVWIMGICLLTFALYLSARMGIYQEVIYAKYGKYPKEALFYSHFLALPGFIFLAPDIQKHLDIAFNSQVLYLGIPSILFYLICNVLTQYVCIRSVFTLTSECPSLTVTLVVTLRKFISLIFSIWYFQNPFTVIHWIGTFLVFSGTLLFADFPWVLRRYWQKPLRNKQNAK